MSIEKLTDGGMEIWINATNLTHWTEDIAGTSTVNREAATIHGGIYSCRFDIDAANAYVAIYQSISLLSLKKYKITFWYKNSVVGKTSKITLKDLTATVYLKEDGTWNVGAYSIILPNSTDWKKYELEFYGHADYTGYILILERNNSASSSIYFDDVSILDPVDYTRDGVFLGTGTRIV